MSATKPPIQGDREMVAPVSDKQRIASLDIIRGASVLGILMISPIWLKRFRFGFNNTGLHQNLKTI